MHAHGAALSHMSRSPWDGMSSLNNQEGLSFILPIIFMFVPKCSTNKGSFCPLLGTYFQAWFRKTESQFSFHFQHSGIFLYFSILYHSWGKQDISEFTFSQRNTGSHSRSIMAENPKAINLQNVPGNPRIP